MNYGGNPTQDSYQVYYFENCIQNVSEIDEAVKEDGGQLQSVLVTNQHGGYDFIINRLFIFFWEDSTIQYGVLSEGIDKKEAYTKADFTLDDLDEYSYIKDLRTGSNPEIFIFAIQ